MKTWDKASIASKELKPINTKPQYFWCDWCRKFYEMSQFGQSFMDGLTICQNCESND